MKTLSSVSIMKHKWRTLLRSYEVALRRYLRQGSTASLQPALRLGQQAVRLGVETLDLALIHEQALLVQVLSVGTAEARRRIIKRAKAFFAEAIIPMEETHRSALEANVRLSTLNRKLSRRTSDLVASNLQLKKEIARRRVVAQTLRQSERHTSRLLNESRRLQEQLRLLSHRILLAQEEERKRISRELHDVIAQVLTSINVRLSALKADATVNTSGLSKNIARTQKLVEKSVDIVHRFAYDFRPAALEHLGLIPALHSFMKRFTKETGILVSLTVFAGVEKLNSTKRTVLYRVAHEALTNVARHAQASRAEVSIRRLPNAICMKIRDNGRSFQLERKGGSGKSERLGLLGMRERVEMVGGKFTVESKPGEGTTISAQIPFSNNLRGRANL